MNSYRNDLHNSKLSQENIASETNSLYCYVPLPDAINTIDAIEMDVNDILDILNPIEGLSEVDKAKEKLKSLSSKLY